MAVSTATIVVNAYPKGYDNTQRFEYVNGTITVTSGTYPGNSPRATSTGYPLNWSNIEGLKVIPDPAHGGNPFPVNVDIQSTQAPPSGYIYFWDSVDGNFHVFCAANSTSGNSGPLVEGFGEGTSTTPGNFLSDVIAFQAWFPRQ